METNNYIAALNVLKRLNNCAVRLDKRCCAGIKCDDCGLFVTEEDMTNMFSSAICAIEKQTPYYPLRFEHVYRKGARCVCGYVFGDDKLKYCLDCGQLLDWGE